MIIIMSHVKPAPFANHPFPEQRPAALLAAMAQEEGEGERTREPSRTYTLDARP